MSSSPNLTRRQWIALAASPALAAGLPDSRHLVATPAKRAEYLQQMLRELCAGPRFACTPACEAGALAIQREMKRALPLVSLDTFSITGWALESEPQLRIGDTRVETFPAHSGPGTPAAGVRGIARAGQKSGYEIVGQPGGRVLARIFPGPFGPAVTTRYRGSDGVPIFSIGRNDLPLFEKAVRESTPVYARAHVRSLPNCRTSNVAGTLPGESAEEILYVAHADTVYNSPGASDNTATTIAMVMLAHALSGERPKRTITFLASTAEEMGSLGAAHYAQTRNNAGTLNRIKICINLDSLTYGQNFLITTTDRELERILLDVHRDLNIRSEPKVIPQDDTMDSAPFKAAGARTLYINSRGHDARTLPLNHRPDDTAATIDPGLIENSFRILFEFTRRLDSMPFADALRYK